MSSAVQEVIISADSHVIEPHDLWAKAIPWAAEHLPVFEPRASGPGGREHRGEGQNPYTRPEEMAADGVSAEVLYATFGLRLYGMEHAEAQEAAFQVFNDWLIDYCAPNLDRLAGIACISVYNIDRAVKELERCAAAGLKGAMIWQVPPPHLHFNSEHYYPFWEAAEALKMPVSLHILTGHNYTRDRESYRGVEHYRASVHTKVTEAANALMDLVFFGVLERYPELKIVSVENEIGWIPFYVQQWDYYFGRHRKADPPAIDREPSFYVNRQVYATFFNDAVGGQNLRYWGEDNCMWSSDYPHANSPWPHSRKVIERDLGHLSPEAKQKLVRDNVLKLYGMTVPSPV
jgi:predicted TIM-barrel fold metal-dependent hydrolase